MLTSDLTALATPAASALYPCFSRADIAFSHGDGAWLRATDGRWFLDFASGIAVTALGHSHPRLIDALDDRRSVSGTSPMLIRSRSRSCSPNGCAK